MIDSTSSPRHADNNNFIDLNKQAVRVRDALKLLQTQNAILQRRSIELDANLLEQVQQLNQQMAQLSEMVDILRAELKSLRALATTSALVNSSLTRIDVLNQVMDTVIALTGAERGYIMLLNKDTGELEFKVARGMDQNQLADEKLIVSRSIVKQVADSGTAVLTDNASEDAQYQSQQSIISNALRSILAVPLKLRGNVIGVVYCDNRFFSGLFTEREKQTLTDFANQAAVAIENARLFDSLRDSVDEVSELRDRMSNLFDSLASAVITIDTDNRILITNAAAAQVLGRDDLVGQSLDAALAHSLPELETVIAKVQAESSTEMITLNPENGTDMAEWRLVVSPLVDEQDTPQGVAIVLDDLTEQRTRERQLDEVRRYLPLALIENMHNLDSIDTGAQEREITALFADVRGFTTFSERLEPEALMQIINKYLSLASDAINLFEGIVDKYMGDAVTGLFNTQLNKQEDHAVRAVQAALQLVLDLYAQHEVLPENDRLYYGIGIHTGPAVLGNVGGQNRKEFAALGEATEVCKYLQEQAGPGEIIISGATYERIKDHFECEPCTELARPKPEYADMTLYRVRKRRKDARIRSLFIDQELLDLLNSE